MDQSHKHLLVGRWSTIRHSCCTHPKMDLLAGAYARKSMEEQICLSWHWCGIGRILCLPLCYFLWNMSEIAMPLQTRVQSNMQVNGIQIKLCLEIFLLKLERNREKLLNDNTTTITSIIPSTRAITTFFTSITYHAKNEWWYMSGVLTRKLKRVKIH